eukprot:2833782-Rhodomonas_salina.1
MLSAHQCISNSTRGTDSVLSCPSSTLAPLVLQYKPSSLMPVTDTHRHRYTDRHTDTQTDTQTHRHRQTHRHTDTQVHSAIRPLVLAQYTPYSSTCVPGTNDTCPVLTTHVPGTNDARARY